MKYFAFKLCPFVLGIIWGQSYDICSHNNGNIQFLEAFRWNSDFYLFGENNTILRLIKFDWNPETRKFSFDRIERFGPKIWNLSNMKLLFTLNYPGKGQRVVEIDPSNDDNVEQMTANLIELNAVGEILSREKITIDIYKCGSYREPLNLCSLFGKLPEDRLQENLYSISPFPSSSALPPRFFVYYKETPLKSQENECPGCYRSKRFIFIGENVTYDEELTETNWRIDNTTTEPCFDLKGKLVNSSAVLNDYRENGLLFNFDLLEFSGLQYTVYRISVTKEKVLENFDKLIGGSIGSFFNCDQSSAVTEPNITNTEEPNESKTTDSDIEKNTVNVTEESKSNTGIVIIIIVLIIVFILLFIGFIWYFIYKRKDGSPPPSPQPKQNSGSKSGPTIDITEANVTPTLSGTKSIRSGI